MNAQSLGPDKQEELLRLSTQAARVYRLWRAVEEEWVFPIDFDNELYKALRVVEDKKDEHLSKLIDYIEGNLS